MLNKELLMLRSGSLEPVLSIYISPDLSSLPTVAGKLFSGESFVVHNAGATTFKFSELDLNAIISVRYYEDTNPTFSNLKLTFADYSGRDKRALAIMKDSFRIRDKTQSASILLV